MKIHPVLRWIAGIPLLLLLVLFALSNMDPVTIDLFPFGELPFQPPLSLALLTALGIGFLMGGIRVRIAEYRHRRAARQAVESVRLLEAKHRETQHGGARAGQALAPRP